MKLPGSLPPLPARLPQDPGSPEARIVAREFETLFVSTLVKTMRATAAPEEQSSAQETYQELYDAQLAESFAGTGGTGIAELILEWMRATSAGPRAKAAGAACGIYSKASL